MPGETTQDLAYVMADTTTRIRALESKYNLFTERLLIVNQNMIEEYKKMMKELKIINQEMLSLKAEIAEVKGVIKNIVTEMDLFAKKENVKVLEKYLDLWSPVNFVTETEVRKIIKERREEPHASTD